MKIDRLMGILTVLLRRERVTAAHLARWFEASGRAIDGGTRIAVHDYSAGGLPGRGLPGEDLLHQFSYDAQQGDGGRRIAQCRNWCKKARLSETSKRTVPTAWLFWRQFAVDKGRGY